MDLVQTLTQSMSDYSQDTLGWVNHIVTSSSQLVGFYMVGILLILDIIKLFEKVNTSNGGIVTLKMFQGLALRSALGTVMVGLSSYILHFILLIGIGFAKLISQNANGSFDVFVLPTVEMSVDMLSILGDLVGAFVNPSAALSKAVIVLLLMIVGAIVTLAAFVMVWVIVMLRFFQLYVMLALMPIPMASFASEEHDNVGKGYIKKVLAYAFQPAVIMVVFGVYHFISKIVIDLSGFGNPMDMDINVMFFKNLILAIVFIIVLWQTHKKSSEMFGV